VGGVGDDGPAANGVADTQSEGNSNLYKDVASHDDAFMGSSLPARRRRRPSYLNEYAL